MSYSIRLKDPVTSDQLYLDAPHQMQGGMYALGGTTEARLTVTYNYTDIIDRVLDDPEGIRSIYGKTGAESIPILDAAIRQLSNDVDEDYWKATEGNVKQALLQLRALALLRPDGVWAGD